jgi:hypothetical protein
MVKRDLWTTNICFSRVCMQTALKKKQFGNYAQQGKTHNRIQVQFIQVDGIFPVHFLILVAEPGKRGPRFPWLGIAATRKIPGTPAALGRQPHFVLAALRRSQCCDALASWAIFGLGVVQLTVIATVAILHQGLVVGPDGFVCARGSCHGISCPCAIACCFRGEIVVAALKGCKKQKR